MMAPDPEQEATLDNSHFCPNLFLDNAAIKSFLMIIYKATNNN